MVKNPILIEDFLENVIHFYEKIMEVNSLYDNLIKICTTCNEMADQDSQEWKSEKEEEFHQAWKNLIDESENFFDTDIMINDDISVVESIIASTNLNAKIFEIDIIDGIKFTPVERRLTKAVVYYSVENNQDDESKTSSFPRFGLSIVLALSYNDRNFQVAIARSKDGCNNLFIPRFVIKDLIIIGKKTAIQFQSPEVFGDILGFTEKVIEALNDYLETAGLEKLIRHLEIQADQTM